MQRSGFLLQAGFETAGWNVRGAPGTPGAGMFFGWIAGKERACDRKNSRGPWRRAQDFSARVAVFLPLPDSGFIAGQWVVIDGERLIAR